MATMFSEGNHPQTGTPAATCYANTFGVTVTATGRVTPCVSQGQKAEFVFGNTEKGVDTKRNGMGVYLKSQRHSGGMGVSALAGGAITAGHRVGVGLVSFTFNVFGSEQTTTLPVPIDEDDLDDGDWLVARAAFGSSSTEKDEFGYPSIALEFLDIPVQKGAAQTDEDTITFPFDLADVANGDLVTDFAPGFAGDVLGLEFVVTDPATTAAKTATVHVEINATPVTGGVLTITSATATPLGHIIAATAVTALNHFDADDTLSLVAAAVTAFVEGAGVFVIRIRKTAS